MTDGPDRALASIASYGRLEPGWGGPGSVVPTPEVLRAAADAVAAAAGAGLPAPHASASTDGEVGLSWFSGRDRMELMLDVEGWAVWVHQVGRDVLPGRQVRYDDPAYPDAVLAGLRDLLDGAVAGRRDARA